MQTYELGGSVSRTANTPSVYYRIFTELRYPIQVDIFDIKSKFLKMYWPNEYPHWQIHNNNIIRLIQTEKYEDSKEYLIIDPSRIIFNVEEPVTKNYFSDKFKKNMKMFLKIVKPHIINRIGVRGFFCIEGISFDHIIGHANNGKLFNKELLASISPEYKIDDFSVTFEQKNSRIIFGPMKKTEENDYLKEFKNIDKLPKEFTFLILIITKQISILIN